MRFASLCLCTALVAACSSTPAAVSEKGFGSVRIGNTSRAEIDERFGAPTWVEFLDWGQERLIYHHPMPWKRHEFDAWHYHTSKVLEAVYDLRDGVVVDKAWARLQDGAVVERKGDR
ncbi:MAG: hypothetical protein IPK26_11740 [Planctomycetes bacterium]|nr:hypothetical protein [Planctomycetota bacterium]